ncbi:uncharacterized protein LOC133190435 [Saccostrea echinata]|uniref:uncharacterized protein LOC133190435 n=1 Tax=Saccostrea echinata TaxID=191078 RepID=UPI002A81F1BD|nr:uncharacterized protein LOC133190435 [Saccostrea echinata]
MMASFSRTQQTSWMLSKQHLPDFSVRVEFNYTSTGSGELFFSYGQGEPVKWFTRFYTRGDNGIWKSSSVVIPAGLRTFYYFTGRIGGMNGFGTVAVDNVRVIQI